jgi:hypothetical protein
MKAAPTIAPTAPANTHRRTLPSSDSDSRNDTSPGSTSYAVSIPCGGADGPGHRHGTLILQRHTPHGWVEVTAEPSTVGCVAVFHLQPADTVVYRGFWPSQDADHQPGYSRQFRVAV